MSTDVQTNVPDWGVDLEPHLRPAYPKEKRPEGGTGAHWSVPDQQPVNVEVFHSTERPEITHVFGTAAPPRGLSGRIRRKAYEYSEGRMEHWFMLMAADRVDVVEGLIEDLSRGHLPNLWKEMGMKADLKHNPKRLLKSALFGGLLAAGVMGLAAGAATSWSRRKS
jgi:hypothetical protein